MEKTNLQARQKAINLYGVNWWERFLSNFKFWEEPYEVVEKMLPKRGLIADLGCGEGFLSNFLVISEPKRKVIGYEIAPERLTRAEKGIENTSYKLADIVSVSYPKADVFVLFHVLHHLRSQKAQEKILKKIKKKLKAGGKLVIVEIYVEPSVKYLGTWIADNFLVPWVFEKRFYTRAYFRNRKEWAQLLKKLGYKVKITLEVEGRPFPNIIFECTKKD